MCFNQKGVISALNGGSLKLVDKFTKFGSILTLFWRPTENNINIRLGKVWTAINRLSIIGKSNLSDKIKRNFFQKSGHINSSIWILTKRIKKKLDRNCTRILLSILNKSLKQRLQNSSCMVTYIPSQKPSK